LIRLPIALQEVTMSNDAIKTLAQADYEAGFETHVESVSLPPGITKENIESLSKIKGEPRWLLEWRLNAFEKWLAMKAPEWLDGSVPTIDLAAVSLYSAPKPGPASLDEVDPKILATFEKLGVPLGERAALAGVAVDAVFDSVSVATTFKAKLGEAGVIFCSFGEASREHSELVRQYLGSVIPPSDNYYAALNSAAFSDGSFVFVPKGVKCPMELSTYFRINAKNTGQFERTLIIAEEGASLSYLEGCTAIAREEHQLHAAVVELIALDGASIKYSTVQNWYPGDANGVGGVLNFVTKRGECRGPRSKISWTQVETGSAVTWKYPSVILRGDDSVGEFFSVALSSRAQVADTGTKMIHLGARTKSTIISKGISAQKGSNTYRGIVRIGPNAVGAVNSTKCDSLLIGSACRASTYPTTESRRLDAQIDHEASTSSVSEEQMHFLASRGFGVEDAMGLIVNGFCKDVVKQLPMEFAVEAQKLLGVSLEGAIG
jgi:Fe-S cluster assembly protein SufB